MIANQLVATGTNSHTLAFSGFGGQYLILAGLIFFLVGYFSLSPYSKIRKFFEDNKPKKK